MLHPEIDLFPLKNRDLCSCYKFHQWIQYLIQSHTPCLLLLMIPDWTHPVLLGSSQCFCLHLWKLPQCLQTLRLSATTHACCFSGWQCSSLTNYCSSLSHYCHSVNQWHQLPCPWWRILVFRADPRHQLQPPAVCVDTQSICVTHLHTWNISTVLSWHTPYKSHHLLYSKRHLQYLCERVQEHEHLPPQRQHMF